MEINSQKELMAWLINFMADTFGNSAILKGGMELYLLDCPRNTNDIDYVFVPYSSNKDVSDLVISALKKVPGMKVTGTINSKCFRCICEFGTIKTQLEINVAEECSSQELSTASFSKKYNQQGRIIRAMDFETALAHKIAAWNERNLIRDLYDIFFMVHILEITPDIETLKKRLAKSLIRKGRKTQKAKMSLPDLVGKLRAADSGLTQSDVSEQMRDYLAPEELPGLDKKIKIGLKKLDETLSDL